jgi:hypothetical protein
MIHSIEHTTISIPVTNSDRLQAHIFAQQQPTSARAEQVRRNTLAVLAVFHYCQMLNIKTQLELSHSWNPIARLSADVADLWIVDAKGHLECRAIAQGESKCIVPEEVLTDRIGYLIVQLDEPYQEAILLGFVSEVVGTELPLSYLKSLDEFVDAIAVPLIPRLSQWLVKQFESTWQPNLDLLKPTKNPILQMCSSEREVRQELVQQVETLYQKQLNQFKNAPVPAIAPDPTTALVHLMHVTQDDEIRWQAAELLWDIDPQHGAGAVKSAKDLGLYLAGHQVALMIGVLAKPDGKLLILTRVYPIGGEALLPPGLQLAGSDEAGHAFFNISARQHDDYIQFKFTADVGDRFTIQVSLDDSQVTESFVV